VRYWLMQVDEDTGWEPDHEVDARRWIAAPEILDHLSYPHDTEVVSAALALIPR
jgi:hypothetical protein